MKLTQITTVVLASAMATSVYASNWVSVQTPMTAYVSTGLTAEVTQELVFPDVVKPVNSVPANANSTAAVAPSVTVSVLPNGNVVYTGDSAPGGGAGSQVSQNATGNSLLGQRTAENGVLEISGEPGYSISVQITPDSTTSTIPSGMIFDAKFTNDTNVSATSNQQLDTNGNLVLPFGGRLTVNDTFTVTPGQETTIQLTALINYRG